MLIGIDASRADTVKGTGTENYSLNLIKHLAKTDKANSYILYSQKKLSNELAPENLGANFKNCVIFSPVLWTHSGLLLKIFLNRPDVLFVPAHVLPLIHPKNSVVTIHGLEYEYYPENYTFFSRTYLRQSTIFSARHARKIIVPSESTKKDLVNFYKISADKITVIHHGIGGSFKDKTKHVDMAQEDDGGTEKYILFVGRIEMRKNIIRLVEGFNLFKKKNPSEKNLKLVLAGKKGVGFDKIKKAIDGSPYSKDIIMKGYVSESDKKRLLKNALIFAYLSLYEGFGLPVLEAQAAGIPVVASNVSSIPEVAGNGAILIDPQNIGAIADALSALVLDGELRKKIIDNGFENIKRFSWDRCAKETLKEIVA